MTRTEIPTLHRTAARWLAAVGLALIITSGAAVRADPPQPRGSEGGLRTVIDGETVELPILKTDMTARIQGDLATVRLIQVFANPHAEPLHARYSFPLPADAAVYSMRLISGDQMIEAQIQRAEQARETFTRAVQSGRQAALLSQERPNVFTQEVGNLLPGEPVQVELEYAHVVQKNAGAYRFVFPMVVGPRYLPQPRQAQLGAEFDGPPSAPAEAADDLEIGRWRLPASPPVSRGGSIDAGRVHLRVELESGVPLHSVTSPSHAIRDTPEGESIRVIELEAPRALDDRDFLLDYSLAGDVVEAGVITHAGEGNGFLSLLLEPPRGLAENAIAPRELVFVLDCSGSMAGIPLEASKRFMRRALPQLRRTDYFRIIQFSSTASEWSAEPLPATEQNILNGLAYTEQLSGEGGTEMTSGIRAALGAAVPTGVMRLVVFLTDGYIGNDVEIVRMIQRMRGDARLFSFGVGHSVNRYLIEEMARIGRGVARIVAPTAEADQAADELAARIAAPVLTDIEIDWRGAPVKESFPAVVPDLFLGQSVRVMARYTATGRFRVFVRGTLAGKRIELPLELELSGTPEHSARGALPILWARAQVEDRMTSFLDPARSESERDALQEQVAQLGLTHRLVTRWTSFVAVAKPLVNPGGRALEQDVAVPPVAGVSELAYPEQGSSRTAGPQRPPLTPTPGRSLIASAQGTGSFSGSAAPEPQSWVALLGMLAVASLYWLRRHRAH